MKVGPDRNFQKVNNGDESQDGEQSNSKPYSFKPLLFLVLIDILLIFIYLIADVLYLLTADGLQIINDEGVILDLLYHFFVLLL